LIENIVQTEFDYASDDDWPNNEKIHGWFAPIHHLKGDFFLSDKRYERIKRELKAFEAFVRAEGVRRDRIPDSVRLFVWQRDQGTCVQNGSTSRLEFDHIIHVAKGGSHTERNCQLLCEACNRSKGVNI
jgi:hypothetical protein